jgi:hypothetical protein
VLKDASSLQHGETDSKCESLRRPLSRRCFFYTGNKRLQVIAVKGVASVFQRFETHSINFEVWERGREAFNKLGREGERDSGQRRGVCFSRFETHSINFEVWERGGERERGAFNKL